MSVSRIMNISYINGIVPSIYADTHGTCRCSPNVTARDQSDPDYNMDSTGEVDDSDIHEDNTQCVTERKYIVFESCLLSLFTYCHICGKANRVETQSRGTLLAVTATCPDDHTQKWSSQSLLGSSGAGNILLAAAILYSGTTYSSFAHLARVCGLAIMSERVFYSIQKSVLVPTVNSLWLDHQATVLEFLKGMPSPLKLSGDGRCDSPGYSAKYCTYSVMEQTTSLIADFKLVQVNECSSSVAMEKEGLIRCLDQLIPELDIQTLATDRHPHIPALMRNSYPNINHQFDVWHVSKSITKKLVKKGAVKGCGALLKWVKSISNHFWWSVQTCEGDAQILREKWTSIIHHVVNVHSWSSAQHFLECAHPTLDQTTERRKKWLVLSSPAHEALKEVVLDTKLLQDLNSLTQFCHTGNLEVYHSLLTKYCPKWQHFSYSGMVARTQLAVIDHNMHTNREQVIGKIALYKYIY